jgi:8-amino-7-oxononanoate synthase
MDLLDKCHRYAEMHSTRMGGFNPYFTTVTETDGAEVVMRGRRVVMLGSNSYLGLHTDPRVKEAAIDATRRFGTSSAGSRLLNGNTALHDELEHRMGHFLGKEAVTLFPSGFQTNQGIIAPLLGRGDVVFTDSQDHASIIDGARLGYADRKKFRHNDMDDLERLLQKTDPDAGKLVVVDGLYSMEGDICPLDRLVELKRQYNFRLMVDDAHGLGVLGAGGRGTAEHFGLIDEVDLMMGTFSKAMGSLGGYVAGPKVVIEYLKYNSRALIFASSMTPAAVGAAIGALEIIETEPERRVQLFRNAARLRAGFKALGLQTVEGDSPVVPVIVGDNPLTFQLWERLMEEGVFANPVISPAVPEGMQLIRNCLMATHTSVQIDRVLEIYERAARAVGLLGRQPALMHD